MITYWYSNIVVLDRGEADGEADRPRPPSLMALPTYLAGHAARLGHEQHVELLKSHGLALPHHAVLIALTDYGALAPHELAACLTMRRAHVSTYVEALVGQGLVGREPDPDDRRSHRVQLTAAGRELAGELAVGAARVQEDFLGGLSERERSQLVALLTKIVSHAEAAKRGRP